MKEARQLENAEEILELPISYEEKGKRIGREEGRMEGRMEEKKSVALGLIKEGTSLDVIERVTGLSRKEILQLKNIR